MNTYSFYQRANLEPLWAKGEPDVVVIDVGSDSAGERIVMQCRLKNDHIVETRYKVKGCGHAIAACVWLSEKMIDGQWQQLTGQDAIAAVHLPEDKYHTAWLIEECVQALRKELQNDTNIR